MESIERLENASACRLKYRPIWQNNFISPMEIRKSSFFLIVMVFFLFDQKTFEVIFQENIDGEFSLSMVQCEPTSDENTFGV